METGTHSLETQQYQAFSVLFDPGQKIVFQEKVDFRPIFLVYPFDKEIKYQFFVLNPFFAEATKRNSESVESRQAVTVEQDFMSLNLQRVIFQKILGNPSVACFSGNKSIHFHLRFTEKIDANDERMLIELLKKAFPLSDWGVFADRSKLCRVPGAIRLDNDRLQKIEYIGTRINFAEFIKKLKENTQKISKIPEIANNFTRLFTKGKYTTETILSGDKKLPSLPDALRDLLKCGYTLEDDGIEMLSFCEHEIIKEVWQMAKKTAQNEIDAECLDREVKKMKPVVSKVNWRKEASEAMAGRWQEFYEREGIEKAKKFTNGWMKGFTPGAHSNKAPGFAFRPDNGAFFSFYDCEKGFPQNYLVKSRGLTLEKAWEEIAKCAGIEIPKEKCKYCEQEIQWKSKKPYNMDETPHTCEAKRENLREERKKIRQEKLKVEISNLTESLDYIDADGKVVTGKAAAYFAEKHQEKMIYYHEAFWYYESGVWSMLDDKIIRKMITQMLGKTFSKKNTIEDIIYQLTGMLFNKTPDLFGSHPSLLNFKNAMLDIYTCQIIPHDRKYYSNVQFAFDIPTEILEDDLSKRVEILNAKSPTWIKLLRSLEFVPETYWRLQQWGGYCLTRDTRIEKCLFLKGEGANGKSTYLEGLLSVLKVSAATLEMGQIFDKFKLAELEGKLVNIGTDIDTTCIADPMFKKLVSGEEVSVERKYKHPHQFRPFCKFLFSANDFIPTRDRSHGFFRRFDVIEFKKQFSEAQRDESIKETIKSGAESQGIFLWMFWGLRSLIANKWKMVDSPEFNAAKQEFEMSANPVRQFIENSCIVDKSYLENGDPAACVQASVFRQRYVQWCNEKGYEAMAENKLGREMKHLGYENKQKRVCGKKEYYYIGVSLI